MSNLVDYARKELERAGYFDKEEIYNGKIGEAVMELVEKFSSQRHSGMSAAIVRGLFDIVSAYLPLTPLTGEDDEWTDVSHLSGDKKILYQNNRCFSVFKDGDGKCWYTEGKVFREPSGACFTNKNSHVEITFPYVPKVEYVDVDSDEE